MHPLQRCTRPTAIRGISIFSTFWGRALFALTSPSYIYFPRCTLVCNTLGSNWARSTYTYYVLLYVVHFRILFFSSFSLACSGGQILSKNRACKTWCYMYIPREVAPTTRLARLRKNGCTEFFLILMIACNVDLSSMVRFWRNSDGLNFFLCGQTWRGGRRGGGCGGSLLYCTV